MNQDIKITAEPSADGSQCTFVVDRPLLIGASFFFAHPEQAAGSPLAERILALDGVVSVLVADNKLTITRQGYDDLLPLAKSVGGTIRECLQSSQAPFASDLLDRLPDEDQLRAKVQALLESDVNPAIAAHGGVITLLDVKGNSIFLKMGGGCQGCGAANVTLRQGVEKLLREHVPELGEVLDTTDHASGRNPYYAPSK